MRNGKFVTKLSGDIKYRAFIPSPPDFEIRYDDSLNRILSQADLALGRLDGIAEIMPNVDYFIFMYVGKEATLSSQIEGTQATFSDFLKAEANIMASYMSTDPSPLMSPGNDTTTFTVIVLSAKSVSLGTNPTPTVTT